MVVSLARKPKLSVQGVEFRFAVNKLSLNGTILITRMELQAKRGGPGLLALVIYKTMQSEIPY